MVNLLAHFGLVHALYGGFFEWTGVIGALLPDLPGVIGWIRFLLNPAGRPLGWWGEMPSWARNWYWIMHSLPFALVLLILEVLLRTLYNSAQLYGLNFHGGIAVLPLFSFGYLTHVLSDWVTHRQDIGDILLRSTGIIWGVDWFQTRFFWTEWAGVGVVLLVFAAGQSNVLLDWVR